GSARVEPCPQSQQIPRKCDWSALGNTVDRSCPIPCPSQSALHVRDLVLEAVRPCDCVTSLQSIDKKQVRWRQQELPSSRISYKLFTICQQHRPVTAQSAPSQSSNDGAN